MGMRRPKESVLVLRNEKLKIENISVLSYHSIHPTLWICFESQDPSEQIILGGIFHILWVFPKIMVPPNHPF